MSLGTRIKDARVQRGMTQKQLVGDRITRNMLSKIENGSATPSMRTLEYLAAQLELPMSYFLQDTSYSDGTSPDGLDEMRAAYRNGEYVRCIELLEAAQIPATTDEGYLLHTRAAIAAAREAVRTGDFEAAKGYADMADYYNKETLYYSAETDAEMSLILAECSLELDLSEFQENAEEFARNVRSILFEDRYALARAEYLLKTGDAAGAGKVLADMAEPEPEFRAKQLYLRARVLEDTGRPGALELLRQAEPLAGVDTRLLKDIYARLETLYLAAEDYKQAHHYAAKQLLR